MSVTRQRTTWDRLASGHPATPVDSEGPAIPGTPEDPAMDAYALGNPSEWAEDPAPGPYPESGHPALPDEGSAWDKAAALESKAAKCITIATAALGDPRGDKVKVAAIEARAVSLLSLPMSQIESTLKRLASEKKAAESDPEAPPEVVEAKKKAAALRRAAEEAEAEAAEKAATLDPARAIAASVKEASALKGRVARIERILLRLAAEEEAEEAEEPDETTEETPMMEATAMKERLARLERIVLRRKASEEAPPESEKTKEAALKLKAECEKAEEEAKTAAKKAAALRRRLAGEPGPEKPKEEPAKEASFDAEEAALNTMLAEEGMGAEDSSLEMLLAEEGMDTQAAPYVEEVEAPMDFGFGEYTDPMGMMDVSMSDDERLLLASLHVRAEDAPAEEPKEGPKVKEARLLAAAKAAAENRTARASTAPRPQPRTASNGATRLGGPVTRAASSPDSELESLWPTAPDVSKYF